METSYTNYEIYDIIDNHKVSIEVLELNMNNYEGTNFTISLTNKTNNAILLNGEQFLILDDYGKMIKPRVKSLSLAMNAFVVKIQDEVPPFVPAGQRVVFKLEYEGLTTDIIKLWFNIENIIENKAYIIEKWMLLLSVNSFDSSILKQGDLAHIVNFAYRYNKIDKIKPYFASDQIKISSDVLDRLSFELDGEFLKENYSMIDNDIIYDFLMNKNLYNMNLAKIYLSTNELRDYIKKNLIYIEENITKTESWIFHCTDKDEYMHIELIEKVIEWSMVYTKSLKEWHYSYINDDFFKKKRQAFKNLNLTYSLVLFNTKLSPKNVNSILITKEFIDISSQALDQLQSSYKGITDDTIRKIKDPVSKQKYTEDFYK